MKEGILASGFITATPLLTTAWAYVSLSFAFGSVRSRGDLSSLPVILLIFGGGVFLVSLVGEGSGGVLMAALDDLSTLAAGLYALPATVAGVAALVIGIWERRPRY